MLGLNGDQTHAIGNRYMIQPERGTRTAIQISTKPAVYMCKVQGNYEGKKVGGDRRLNNRFVPCLQKQNACKRSPAPVTLQNYSTSRALYIYYLLYSYMTEDSATVDNINKTALGGKTGTVDNVEENCRGHMQKFQLIT